MLPVLTEGRSKRRRRRLLDLLAVVVFGTGVAVLCGTAVVLLIL